MTPPPAYFPQAGEQALTGIRVVFPAALGPVPFAAMLLADLGAEVIRIDRAGAAGVIDTAPADDPRTRGQRSIGIDLKHPEGCAIAARLAASADVLLEGMRPGAMERLRLGPADLHAVNPRLIYGRATGWGQDGPLAQTVGHDINYIARSGALHPIGDPDRPPAVPLNLVADFGGGGAYLALGVLAALMQRERTGRGQVIDCAMVDGAASLTTMIHAMLGSGAWRPERGANLLDGAAPFTAPTARPTAGTSRWARSSPPSTARCWTDSASSRPSGRSTTGPAGPGSGPRWQRSSPLGPGPNGWSGFAGATPA